MNNPNKVTKHELLRGSQEELLKYIIDTYNINPPIKTGEKREDGKNYELEDHTIAEQLQNAVDSGHAMTMVFFLKCKDMESVDDFEAQQISFESLFVFIRDTLIKTDDGWKLEKDL
jgi:hypothetical protein